MMLQIGSAIAWLAGVVVLIKLFQQEGVIKGIIGFVCMLYTFVWGWQNIKREELKLKTWMYVWSGAIVVGMILGAMGAGNVSGGDMDGSATEAPYATEAP